MFRLLRFVSFPGRLLPPSLLLSALVFFPRPAFGEDEMRDAALVRVVTLDERAPFRSENWPVSPRITSCREFQSADLNGDQKADLLYTDGGSLRIALNLGDRFEFRDVFTSEAAAEMHIAHGRFRCGPDRQVIAFSNGDYLLLDQARSGKIKVESPAGPLPQAVRLTAGDVDDDGIDELVVLDAANHLRIYKIQYDGGAAATLTALSKRRLDDRPAALVVADVSGAGSAAALIPTELEPHSFPGFSSIVLTGDSSHPAWGQLGPLMKPELWAAGDFNADGRSDVIAYTGNIYRWWLMQSIGESSIEIPVRGIDVPARLREALAGGDVDGDGQDDVILCNSKEDFVTIAKSSIAAPLAAAELTEAGVRRISPGTFALPHPPSQAPEIQAPGYRTAYTNWRAPSAAEHCGPRRFSAVAIEDAKDKAVTGQAIRIGPPAAGPYVCTGFNPEGPTKWPSKIGNCPPGYAFFEADDVGGPKVPKSKFFITGSCCRLPSDDILTEEIINTDGQCPESSLAVGQSANAPCPNCEYKLVCKKINTARYQLGPPTQGQYFGGGISKRSYSEGIAEQNIPLAIRSGVLRWSYAKQQVDGCLGYPFGSMLTAKGRSCDEIFFRALQYAGQPGDPPAGTPVKMFPDCEALDNPLSPSAGCRKTRAK